jgi:hypothetical protein
MKMQLLTLQAFCEQHCSTVTPENRGVPGSHPSLAIGGDPGDQGAFRGWDGRRAKGRGASIAAGTQSGAQWPACGGPGDDEIDGSDAVSLADSRTHPPHRHARVASRSERALSASPDDRWSSAAGVSPASVETPACQRSSGVSAPGACRPLVRFVHLGSETAVTDWTLDGSVHREVAVSPCTPARRAQRARRGSARGRPHSSESAPVPPAFRTLRDGRLRCLAVPF